MKSEGKQLWVLKTLSANLRRARPSQAARRGSAVARGSIGTTIGQKYVHSWRGFLSHRHMKLTNAQDSDREHRHRHHHSSRHDRDRDDNREDRHSNKRSRHHRERETSEERARRKRRERGRDDDHEQSSRRKHQDSSDEEDRISRKRKSRRDDDDLSPSEEDDDEVPDAWKDYVPPEDELLDQQLEEAADANLQRDDWMQAPSTLDVDYVQRKKKEEKSQFVGAMGDPEAAHRLKVHEAEIGRHLADVNGDDEKMQEVPAQRDVGYTFGDGGSQWRMTKLKGVYRIAEESKRSVEDVALEKYGDLRDFDDAREEEVEVERRQMYGRDYVGKEKPSGELFEERRLKAGIHRPPRDQPEEIGDLPQGEIVDDPQPASSAARYSQTDLNRMKAQVMKAKMKKASNAAQLEKEYEAAAAAFSSNPKPDVITLGAMDNRMLAGGRKGEVVAITNKRGQERGLVKENEEMSIEDMVRQERRTKGQAGGEGRLLAEKIAKDAKFDVSQHTFPLPIHILTDNA